MIHKTVEKNQKIILERCQNNIIYEMIYRTNENKEEKKEKKETIQRRR